MNLYEIFKLLPIFTDALDLSRYPNPTSLHAGVQVRDDGNLLLR